MILMINVIIQLHGGLVWVWFGLVGNECRLLQPRTRPGVNDSQRPHRQQEEDDDDGDGD